MRSWTKAKSWLPCGAEMGCLIYEGEPYLILTGENWQKVRCAKHAGEPIPKDSEMWEQRPASPSGFAGARELAGRLRMGPKLLTFDARARAARNDE